jgi:hypothetical protein
MLQGAFFVPRRKGRDAAMLDVIVKLFRDGVMVRRTGRSRSAKSGTAVLGFCVLGEMVLGNAQGGGGTG